MGEPVDERQARLIMNELKRKAIRSFRLFRHVAAQDIPKALLLLFALFLYNLIRILINESFAVRFLGKRSIILRIGKSRFDIPVRSGDMGVIFDCVIDGMYERDDRFLPKDGAVCLDIGANIGACTAKWLIRCRPIKVIAVEPHPETFKRLKKNVELNSWQNIELVEAAISSKDGFVPIRMSKEGTMAVVCNDVESEIQVRAVTLNTLFNELKIETVDLCKIDVEGYEVAVLQGASSVLDKIERVIIEYHSYSLKDNVIEILREHFKIIRSDDARSGLIYAINKKNRRL